MIALLELGYLAVFWGVVLFTPRKFSVVGFAAFRVVPWIMLTLVLTISLAAFGAMPPPEGQTIESGVDAARSMTFFSAFVFVVCKWLSVHVRVALTAPPPPTGQG